MSNRARTPAMLGAASLVAGVLAYVVFAVLTRQLGPRGAAPVSVLWTWWGLSAAALSFPVQHWIVQMVTTHGGFDVLRRALPALIAIAASAAALTGVGSWALRDQLFHQDGASFPALVAALSAGAVLMGVLRGVLTAHRRYQGLAVSLVGEHVARVVPVGVLAALDVNEPAAYGLVIVLGSYVGLLWPPAFRLPRTGEGRPSYSLLSSAAAGQLLAQLVLTSGPIVLALQGGAPGEVTAMFVAMAVFRAPFILAQGMISPLTARWTSLVTEGRQTELGTARRSIAFVAVAGGLSAAAFGAWAGEWVIQLVFGDGIRLEPVVAALVAGGSMLAVANIGATVLAIAMSSTGRTVLAWSVAVGSGVIVSLLGGDPEIRTAAAFAIAEGVAFVVLSFGLRSRALTVARTAP